MATELQHWPPNSLRRASVNSFGYGGTNAHVILETFDHHIHQDLSTTAKAFPATTDQLHRRLGGSNSEAVSPASQGERIFVLSHKSKAGLSHLATDLIGYLAGREKLGGIKFLDSLAHTLNVHRTTFNWRLAVVAASADDVIQGLNEPNLEPRRALYDPRLAFVFTGQGAQWFAMGRELIDRFPVFKDALSLADNHFHRLGASWTLIGIHNPSLCNTRVDMRR